MDKDYLRIIRYTLSIRSIPYKPCNRDGLITYKQRERELPTLPDGLEYRQ